MTPRILLVLLLLAGLAFRVAHFDDPSPPIVFTSSPRPPSWEEHVRSVGLAGPLALLANGPPQSKELVPPWRPTDLQLPPRRSPAQSHLVLEPEPGIRELRYDNDGTIKLVDSRSQSTLWQFSTGSPLSNYQITTARPDLRYLIYAVNETHLYEVHEQHGAVKLWTIDDFVARTPQVRDSVITIGSKASTVFVVNADNGEIIYKHSLPVDLSELAVPLVEETPSKLDDGRSGSNANIMVIVRTDYSLSASDLGDHLFNWTRTTFTAKFYTKYDHPDMLDESPCLQGDIPVRCIRSEGQGLLKLPLPESTSIALKYMNEVTFGDNASAPELGQSLEESPETADKTNVMLDSAQNETVDGSLIHIISTDPELTTVSSKSVYVLLFVVVLLLVVMACLLSMTDADKSYGRFVTQLMKPIAYDKKLMDSREKPDGTPKKRKARKKDVVVNSPESSSRSDKESSGTDRSTETQINEKYTLIKNMKPLDGHDGRWVGKLFVSNVEIGRGSNGTVVLEGFYDGRPVAVKRLLHSHNDIALKEIQNLIASDQDPNIVRLYGVEQDYDFVYISLERCSCSLADLIQQHSDSSSRDLNSNYQITFSLQLKDSKVMQKNVELWRPDGLPSVQLLKLMRDVVAGLVHLHSLGIIHRDLKPQNVLISMEGPIRAKLSDMGISKRLQDDMTSVSHHGTGFGSSGWQAPEQLRHGRQTRAMDLFSLGCVLFYCISKGKHPFGEYFERDANILNNRFDLFMVDYIPEAVHLLSQLLHPDPEMRPTAVYVFHHPLFWSPELRLSFLRATSDRIDKANETDLVNALESIGPVAFGGKWGEKLDAALVADMGRYRKYNFDSTRDLLRLIRNKSGHYRELPAELQESLGSLPDGFDHYFSSRFPKLLIEVYKVMCVHCKDEEAFSKYF